ncbi:MAG: tetratricopeptide repeat protein [Spirochaetaceae bacterium]|jgi:tetratricopeptide (TPR) repeat protein|nr:tetratricopeptide repeat protein [Spirochaetaceae bacterium]
MKFKKIFLPFVFAMPFFVLNAQQQSRSRLSAGIELYGEGSWNNAIAELRRFQAETSDKTMRAEAQFWIGMSNIAAGRYAEALRDFDEITRIDSASVRNFDAMYQKGRALYYLNNYNDAIIFFKNYSDNISTGNIYSGGSANDSYNRKAAAIFWIGECLYELEELERAAKIYETIVSQYQSSVKYETAQLRLSMIKQKKTEEGLLEIIRLSDSNDEQGGGAYNDALLSYKNSIAPFLLQSQNENSRRETDLKTPVFRPSPLIPGTVPQNTEGQNSAPITTTQDSNTLMRLLQIKTKSLEMMERLTSTLNAFESLEWEKRESW